MGPIGMVACFEWNLVAHNGVAFFLIDLGYYGWRRIDAR